MAFTITKVWCKVVYKLGQVHFLLDHLFIISHGEPIEGVDD
jgi:hypothetical protein